MRVLFVDTGVDGHHPTYLKGLLENCCDKACVYLPTENEFIKDNGCEQIIHPIDWKKKSIIDYYYWISEIVNIAQKFQPDIIHFLDGDTIMRYFGFGLNRLKKWPIVITYHHLFDGRARKISYKMMLKGKNRKCIVHTGKIKKQFIKYGIKNVEHIEYPVFWYKEISNKDPIACKRKLNLPIHIPVLGIIGATDKYKGIKILLESIKDINSNICFYFAGKESDTKREEIESYAIRENVEIVTNLNWLSKDEYIDSIVASDYLILPYTKEFNGASGPLADGVVANKKIIGSDYGSMGDVIIRNKLGYTFKVENSKSLAYVIDKAVKDKMKLGSEYLNYRNELLPERFFCKYRTVYENMTLK